MNNIQYNQGAATFSQVLVVGLGVVIGTCIMQVANLDDGAMQDNSLLFQKSYSVEGVATSYNSHANMFTGKYNATTKDFKEAVGDLYSRLMINQEPLGTEFEKVLNENLWDLYES
jgi:hypothetical protein